MQLLWSVHSDSIGDPKSLKAQHLLLLFSLQVLKDIPKDSFLFLGSMVWVSFSHPLFQLSSCSVIIYDPPGSW